MRRIRLIQLRFFLPLFVLFVLFVVDLRAGEPTYWQDVRPVLRKYCTVCHSARNLKELDVSGGLALDSYEAVLKGSKQPVVHAGKSAESELVKLVTTDDAQKRMPLSAPPLPTETIGLLRRWIDAGLKEGQKPTEDTTPVVTTPARGRKLDVVLATSTTPPEGALGTAKPAKLELALKVGPLSPVTAVAFSPDGMLLVSGSYGRVVVWEMATGRPVKGLVSWL